MDTQLEIQRDIVSAVENSNMLEIDLLALDVFQERLTSMISYDDPVSTTALESLCDLSLEDKDNVIQTIIRSISEAIQRIIGRIIEAIKIMIGATAQIRKKAEKIKDSVRLLRSNRSRPKDSNFYLTTPQRLMVSGKINVDNNIKAVFDEMSPSFDSVIENLTVYLKGYNSLFPKDPISVLTAEKVNQVGELAATFTRKVGYRNNTLGSIKANKQYPNQIWFEFSTVSTDDNKEILKSIQWNRDSSGSGIQEVRLGIESLSDLESMCDSVIRFTRHMDSVRSKYEDFESSLLVTKKLFDPRNINKDREGISLFLKTLKKYDVVPGMASTSDKFSAYRIRFCNDVLKYIESNLEMYS